MASPGRAPARTRAVPLLLTLIFLATEAVLLVNAAAFVLSTRQAARRADQPAEQVAVLDGLQDLRTGRHEAEATAAADRRASARRTSSASVWAALIATVLAMIALAVFYRRMERCLREQRAAAAELQATNESLNALVADRTAELAHLSQHLISVAEEEKAATARELHDALGSNLTAVDIDVKWVEKKLRDAQPELAERLRRALGVLAQTVEINRNVIEALRPSLLDMLGLATALESLCEEFMRRTGIDVVPDLDQELPDLPPDVSIALYRVVQEALANVEKYAQATVVRVSLQREAEHLRLVIEDDGVGIPEDALGRAASHGLVGMRERLRVLGGAFEIRRGPRGRGTIVDAIAPRPV